MTIFKANKGDFWIYILLSLLLPLSVIFISENVRLISIQFLVLFLPFFIFLWAYLSTKYMIDQNYLFYQSTYLKGKIEIHKIKEIQVNKTLWIGLKPALASKGLIIKYGFDEIYIAPKNNKELIDALLQINPIINIK